MKCLLPLSMAILLVGCVTPDPNASSKFVGLALMGFRATKVETNVFELRARGAGAHSPEQVQAGFDARAKELCNGSSFTQEAETTRYTYNSQGGGNFFTHSAHQRTGKIFCK
jgi:hypothetical protein